MSAVAIVADSIACLTKEQIERYKISVAPINFYFGKKIYRDGVDITTNEAYELFLKDPESFNTSAVNPDDFFKAIYQASKQADKILCITISSKLSAVYDIALSVKERARIQLPQVSVDVLDTRTAAAAEGLIVLAATRAAAEDKSLDEVVKIATKVRDSVTLAILLDTIRHVYRSGRIPKVAAWAGSLLSIKPILTVSPSTSGVVRPVSAVRNRNHGIDYLLKLMREHVGNKPVHVSVTHAYALDQAEALKKRISAEFNCAELWLTEFSPVMGYACGTGTVGIGFYPEI